MHRSRTLLALALLCGPAACDSSYDGGKDEDTETAVPLLDASPASIDFGALEAGEQASAVVTLTNRGDAPVSILSLTVDGPEAFTVNTAGMAEEVYGGGSFTEFVVTYTASGGFDQGAIEIESTDYEYAWDYVQLQGGQALPEITWSEDPLDFGSVPVGQAASQHAVLQNTSTADLVVDEIAVSGDGYSAEPPPLPLTLGSGEAIQIPVTFTPSAAGPAPGSLTVTSNAAADNVLDLSAAGHDPLVAVCSVEPSEVVSHAEKPIWRGEESYASSGAAIVGYEWTLVSQPAGSAAVLEAAGADSFPFAWDLAGEYVAELVVTDENGGVSEPCQATLTAAPADDLWIELFWTLAGDDMDLHLLAPGGELETESDCYFSNCVPAFSGVIDWGVAGVEVDDPVLDLDDIEGTGPENIRLAAPEDGEFTVVVHDFPGAGDPVFANAATVNVYVGGELAFSQTCDIDGDDTYTELATISFPDGVVTGSACP